MKPHLMKIRDGRWYCVWGLDRYLMGEHIGVGQTPAEAFENLRHAYQHCVDQHCRSIGNKLAYFPSAF